MGKDNLINLAKGSGKKLTPAPTRKTLVRPVAKVVEKPKKTKEEERDEKAKETVEKLLQDVELTPKKDVEIVETEAIVAPASANVGVEWLEEQITLLSEQNEQLQAEVNAAREDYSKLFQKMQSGGGNDLEFETVKQNVILFFTDMQNNYMGFNPERQRYQFAYPKALLPQLVQLFPFLENYRRF